MNGFTLRGHPLHPVFAIAPLSLLASSLAMDVARLATGESDYAEAARWALGAGVVAGVVAALPGLVDTLAYPRSARGVPIRHAVLSTSGLALMAAGWWLRQGEATSTAALVLSLAAAVLTITARRIGMRLTPAPPRVRK